MFTKTCSERARLTGRDFGLPFLLQCTYKHASNKPTLRKTGRRLRCGSFANTRSAQCCCPLALKSLPGHFMINSLLVSSLKCRRLGLHGRAVRVDEVIVDCLSKQNCKYVPAQEFAVEVQPWAGTPPPFNSITAPSCPWFDVVHPAASMQEDPLKLPESSHNFPLSDTNTHTLSKHLLYLNWASSGALGKNLMGIVVKETSCWVNFWGTVV